MLGKLTGEYKAAGRLYLPGAHGFPLVVLHQPSCLSGDPTESVGDERVQDGHGPLGDAGVRVDLLEHAVDVDVVGLLVLAFVGPLHFLVLLVCLLLLSSLILHLVLHKTHQSLASFMFPFFGKVHILVP